MSYLDKNLLPGETVLFRTKKHLIIFLTPAFLTVLSVIATVYMEGYPFLAQLIWAPWVVTLIYWSYCYLEYLTSQFSVTDKRIMMREGFFNRHVAELRINAISQITVDQSLLGQILNYGTVNLNAFGAFDAFPYLSKPNQFKQAVYEEINKLTQ